MPLLYSLRRSAVIALAIAVMHGLTTAQAFGEHTISTYIDPDFDGSTVFNTVAGSDSYSDESGCDHHYDIRAEITGASGNASRTVSSTGTWTSIAFADFGPHNFYVDFWVDCGCGGAPNGGDGVQGGISEVKANYYLDEVLSGDRADYDRCDSGPCPSMRMYEISNPTQYRYIRSGKLSLPGPAYICGSIFNNAIASCATPIPPD